MVEMKHPEHLLLVDGHSLAYRAFYALPLDNFATSAGQPTNAVFGFTSMLINAIKDYKCCLWFYLNAHQCHKR